MSRNRITHGQPDHVFMIVRKPANWRPRNYFDKPPHGEILSRSYVASYPEAHDDLQRCNQLSLRHSLDTWAVVEVVEAQL